MQRKDVTEPPMDEPFPIPSLNDLRQASDKAVKAAEKTEKELKPLFDAIAAMSLDKEDHSRLNEEISGKIDDLKIIRGDLKEALSKSRSMEDELSARFKDIQKNLNRKWYLPNPPANGTIDIEEMNKKHFAQGINIYKLMLVCFIGSFAGVAMETVWCLLKNGYIESRAGLVYGPFNLLYGAGAVVLTVALYNLRNRGAWLSFVSGAVVGSVLEYVCSWGQELLFGSRSWDYSNVPFNINGRICLLYSCFWGILGVVWIKYLYPQMSKWILKLPNKGGKILSWCLTAFLAFNAVMSVTSVWRWSERVKDIPPSNAVWEFIDERFPDERMERIYANMRFGSD